MRRTASGSGIPGEHRRVLTRLHVVSDLTQDPTVEGDALTEEGDPDGTGPKVSSGD